MINNQDLKESAFLTLNKQFYESFNTEYFQQKTSFLLALLSDPKYLSRIYKQGVKIENFRANGEELTRDEENQHKELLKTEISLVYYHAIETFFRLFIAHTFKVECPWVEISGLKSYYRFKEEVAKFSEGKFPSEKHDLREVISVVMYGAHKNDELGDSKEIWNKNLSNLSNLIIHLAHDLLGNDDYNTYKHGLGIFTTQLGFELTETPLKREKSECLTL